MSRAEQAAGTRSELMRTARELFAERGYAGVENPWELLVRGVRAFLDACTDRALIRIALVDAPVVLGWDEWREIDARYGLGLVSFGLQNAMDRGVFHRREVRPLAHLLLGAMTEAAMMIAHAPDHEAARREVEDPLLALLEGLRSDRPRRDR